MELGDFIAKMLKKRGMTGTELAKAANMNEAHLGKVLYNLAEAEPHELKAIAQAIDVPPQILLFFNITEADVAEDKRELFRQLEKPMKEFLLNVFDEKD